MSKVGLKANSEGAVFFFNYVVERLSEKDQEVFDVIIEKDDIPEEPEFDKENEKIRLYLKEDETLEWKVEERAK